MPVSTSPRQGMAQSTTTGTRPAAKRQARVDRCLQPYSPSQRHSLVELRRCGRRSRLAGLSRESLDPILSDLTRVNQEVNHEERNLISACLLQSFLSPSTAACTCDSSSLHPPFCSSRWVTSVLSTIQTAMIVMKMDDGPCHCQYYPRPEKKREMQKIEDCRRV